MLALVSGTQPRDQAGSSRVTCSGKTARFLQRYLAGRRRYRSCPVAEGRPDMISPQSTTTVPRGFLDGSLLLEPIPVHRVRGDGSRTAAATLGGCRASCPAWSSCSSRRRCCPSVQPWFEHPEVRRRLGGPEWPARELRLVVSRRGEEYRGREVLRSHSWVAVDDVGAPVGKVGGDVYDRWTRYDGSRPREEPVVTAVEAGPAMGLAYVVDPRSLASGRRSRDAARRRRTPRRCRRARVRGRNRRRQPGEPTLRCRRRLCIRCRRARLGGHHLPPPAPRARARSRTE